MRQTFALLDRKDGKGKGTGKGKGKSKGKSHPRTGHEVPEGGVEV